MYKYNKAQAISRNRVHLIPAFGRPLNHNSGLLIAPHFGAASSTLRGASIAGLGDPTIQITASKPDIRDLIDYLDATVRVRGSVTVPTQRINFLVQLDPPNTPTWWKRLWKDPVQVFPTVRVTVELVQVGKSLFPFSNYSHSVLVDQGLKEYFMRLHSQNPMCGDFVTALGSGFLITTKADIEKELGIPGQLDTLLTRANIKLPLSPAHQQSLFWIVYATFPTELRKYVIPESRVVLSRFEFDKSILTKTHVGQIIAIARHLAAVSKAVAPPKIALTGHTDSRGTEKYNQDLGDRRIAAVRDVLVKAIDSISPGLSSQLSIEAKSFGETKPLVRATSEADHARNRRVEVLMPKPRSRCARVSLRVVIDRTLKLTSRLPREQAQRINCVLQKLKRRASDDRWVYAGLAQNVYNNDLQMGTYAFNLLRDGFTMESIYGPNVSDTQLLKNLELVDGRIIEGIGKVAALMEPLKLAASQGVPLISKMKAMDALRAWMHERIKDDKSIYSCYRNV